MGRPAKLSEPDSGQTLGIGFNQERGDSKTGLVIDKVVPESVAADAGLKVGDRLLVFDDTWINAASDCRWAMNRVKAGAAVAAKIQRDGKDELVTIRFKEGPAKAAPAKETPPTDQPKKEQPNSKDSSLETSSVRQAFQPADLAATLIPIPRQARKPAPRNSIFTPGDVP